MGELSSERSRKMGYLTPVALDPLDNRRAYLVKEAAEALPMYKRWGVEADQVAWDGYGRGSVNFTSGAIRDAEKSAQERARRESVAGARQLMDEMLSNTVKSRTVPPVVSGTFDPSSPEVAPDLATRIQQKNEQEFQDNVAKAKMTLGLGKAGLDMYFGGSGQYEGPLDWYKRQGFKDTDIQQIQQRLIDLGYNVGRTGADGKMGANTIAAIKQFQKDNGLAVDGKFGGQTRLAMQRRIDDAAIEAERKAPRELLSRSVVPGSFAQALPKQQLLQMTQRNEAKERGQIKQDSFDDATEAPYQSNALIGSRQHRVGALVGDPDWVAKTEDKEYYPSNVALAYQSVGLRKLGGRINYQKIFK